MYILELLTMRHCAGCQFYRAEGRGQSWDSEGNHLNSELYNDYKMPMMTDKYGIEFYVRSSSTFDDRYHSGTRAHAVIEDNIIKYYVNKISEIDKEYGNPTQRNVEEMKGKHVDDPINGPTFAPVEEKTNRIRKTEEAIETFNSNHDIQRDREELRKKLHAEMKKVLGLTDRERDKAVRILAQAEDLMVAGQELIACDMVLGKGSGSHQKMPED
nr:peptidyl-prolyl cis-trans isomerase [Tanacetum cinerariifolium]